ncbi:NAD(P)H-binding protein [Paracoccaceae bacterium GXU_MW_L88]
MAQIFIIGATGGVGHRLAPLLVEAGHEVRGLHRKPEQAEDLRAAGVTPAHGDIMEMSAEDVKSAAEGADIIVFSAGAAGSGLDRTTAIDGEGLKKAITAAQAHGARLYLVSVFPDARRGGELGDGFEHYMKVKKDADVALAASGLDWVILRPGTLTHEDADGMVTAGRAIAYGDVKRGNVAATLAALIATPEINHEIIELTDGDTPVADAVAALRRG